MLKAEAIAASTLRVVGKLASAQGAATALQPHRKWNETIA
jgi:hypothetical protein